MNTTNGHSLWIVKTEVFDNVFKRELYISCCVVYHMCKQLDSGFLVNKVSEFLLRDALANYEKNNNCVRWEGVSLLPIFVCFQICRIFCEGVARKPLIKAPTSIDFQVVASYSSQVTWQEASTTTFSCSLPSFVLAALGFMQLKLSVSLPRIKLLSANARATYALTLPHS